MGVQSKMNYSGMNAIVTLIENRMTSINGSLDELSSSVVSKIAESYSGEAATDYQTTLSSISTQMNEDLNSLVTSLKTAITETQADYESQDQKNAASVAEAKAVATSKAD